MVQFPRVSPDFEHLPTDPDERREALISILGQHLSWSRALALDRIRQWIEAAESREQLTDKKCEQYAWVAGLPQEHREIVQAVASDSADTMLKFVLALLANVGFDMK